MNSIRQIVYLLGCSASGKTTTADALNEKYGWAVIHADDIIDRICVLSERGYRLVLSDLEKQVMTVPNFLSHHKKAWLERIEKLGKDLDQSQHAVKLPEVHTLVIEGASPALDYEYNLLKGLFPNAYHWYFHIKPSDHKAFFLKKHAQLLNQKLVDNYQSFVDQMPRPIFAINENVLLQPLPYQRTGLTDEKFKLFQLGNLSGKSVLDIGCNTGWFAKFCHELGCLKYTGIESSIRELIHAIDTAPKGCRFIHDRLQFSFDKSKLELYDVILFCATIHYFDHKEYVLRELKKHLKPDGFLLLELPVDTDHEIDYEYLYPAAGKDVRIPTVTRVENWLSNIFGKYECLGESLSPEPKGKAKKRMIYKAYQI